MDKQNFASKVLQLQLKLQEDRSIETIQEVNEIYRKGIDFYIDDDPKKARLLHKKMMALLARPSIINVLQMNSPSSKIGTQNKSTNLHRKMKNQVNRFHTNADNQIQNIIQKSEDCVNKVQKLKKKDINRQKEELYDRLLMRAKSQEKIKQFKSCKVINSPFIEEDKE